MNAKKRGLGKGLGALISDTEVVEEILKGTESDEIRQIDIELIERNENQPRSEFDNKTLEGLAKSIEEIGVIQPIVIKPQGDKYMIIAGERRYRASKLAGLKKIPAIIKNIEEIDLTTGDHELLNLTLQDVINMTDDRNELIIKGDSADKVTFANNDNWTESDTAENIDGKTFTVYSSTDDSVKVKVENTITDQGIII